MKADEYREKSTDELNQEILDLKSQLFNLRFQHATHQLENTSELRTVKRSLARVNTILRERDIAAAKPAAQK